jgi:sugar-specific transcriptional regulator TrmB
MVSTPPQPPRLLVLMKQFGFDPTVSLVYRALLKDGPLAVAQIARATGQTPAKVYKALERLLGLRLVGLDHDRDTKLYLATNPSLAWLALRADLVWGANVTLQPLRDLPPTDDPRVENLRMLCAEMETEAAKLYKPQSAAWSHKNLYAETREELAQLTCEAIYQAKKRIYAVSRSPRLRQVAAFWAVLTARIDEGVTYHRIVDLEEVVDHGLKIVSRDMEDYHIDLRIIRHERIQNTFYIIDDDRLLAIHHPINLPQPVEHPGVGRITNHHRLIPRWRERFNKLRTDSIPGRFVVERMREASHRLLEEATTKLAPIEVAWLADLIDHGKFSTFHKVEGWSEERLAAVRQRSIAARLVRPNYEGTSVPLYPISEEDLSAAYASANQ